MISVAKILKPHGLKGEVKLEMFNKDTSFWREVKNVYIDKNIYNVIAFRFYKGFLYLFLSGVSSVEEAEKLRNKTLMAREEDVRRGDYIISDLENCSVYDDLGNFVGVVDSIEKYGSADIVNVVKMGAVSSFPFLKDLILNVDIDQKRVVVKKSKLDEVLIWK